MDGDQVSGVSAKDQTEPNVEMLLKQKWNIVTIHRRWIMDEIVLAMSNLKKKYFAMESLPQYRKLADQILALQQVHNFGKIDIFD